MSAKAITTGDLSGLLNRIGLQQSVQKFADEHAARLETSLLAHGLNARVEAHLDGKGGAELEITSYAEPVSVATAVRRFLGREDNQ